MIALTTAAAQDTVSGFRFGYLSYEAALQSMADYQQVQQKMDALRQQFQAETLRVEDGRAARLPEDHPAEAPVGAAGADGA